MEIFLRWYWKCFWLRKSKTNRRYNNFNLEIDGGTAFWNGKNMHNNSVSSGVYLVMLSDLDSYETKILKIMIIR